MKKMMNRRVFLGTLLGSGLSSISYSRYLEPEWLEITEQTVPLLPEHASPIRILHLSDLHASEVVSFDYLNRAISAGLSLQPDIICITGDFISYKFPQTKPYYNLLSRLSAVAPTFAVLGNHDGGNWAKRRGGEQKIDRVVDILKTSNINLLLNQRDTVSIHGQPLHIVGLGDLWAEMFHPENVMEPLTNQIDSPTILLSHNPDTKDRLTKYQWDLMLSGHTHGGQMRVPFFGAPFAPVRDKRFTEGLHRWEKRWLHISRGVGSMYGIRINCRPQVCLLKLMPKTKTI